MSYASFHLIFLLPQILLLGATLPKSLHNIGGRRAQWALPIVCFVAFTYTAAWDNYLVAREVWWYGPNQVYATIGYVPVEEYLFFLLQPILTGLFLFQYLGRTSSPNVKRGASTSAWVGALAFGGLTVLGLVLLGMESDKGLYLGLILSWSAPILLGMWLYGGETLWRFRRTMSYTIGLPTLYLWCADSVAIASGIWTISGQYTLGVALFNLPVEEATFFLMTNALVVKGILLLLYRAPDSMEEVSDLDSGFTGS